MRGSPAPRRHRPTPKWRPKVSTAVSSPPTLWTLPSRTPGRLPPAHHLQPSGGPRRRVPLGSFNWRTRADGKPRRHGACRASRKDVLAALLRTYADCFAPGEADRLCGAFALVADTPRRAVATQVRAPGTSSAPFSRAPLAAAPPPAAAAQSARGASGPIVVEAATPLASPSTPLPQTAVDASASQGTPWDGQSPTAAWGPAASSASAGPEPSPEGVSSTHPWPPPAGGPAEALEFATADPDDPAPVLVTMEGVSGRATPASFCRSALPAPAPPAPGGTRLRP